MEALARETVRALLRPRPVQAHKGTFGHVLIAAGALGYAGAAKLACRAAERSGAGLVTLCTPLPVVPIAAAGLSETMVMGLPATGAGAFAREAAEPLLAQAAQRSAFVVGPGITCCDDTVALVAGMQAGCERPGVIDADGLNALARLGAAAGRAAHGARILTPHPGEMARLLSSTTESVQADRAGAALAAARAFDAVVVLKGHGTLVATPDGRIVLNTTGNEGMATGGTGDVLAGLLGGLLAQGIEAFDAACIAVYAHGLAGDFAAAAKTARGMIASDLIEALPAAWRALEEA